MPRYQFISAILTLGAQGQIQKEEEEIRKHGIDEPPGPY